MAKAKKKNVDGGLGKVEGDLKEVKIEAIRCTAGLVSEVYKGLPERGGISIRGKRGRS